MSFPGPDFIMLCLLVTTSIILFLFFCLLSNPKLLSQKTLETLQLNTFSFIFCHLLPPTLEYGDLRSSSPHTNLLPFPSNTLLYYTYVPLLNGILVFYFDVSRDK